MDNYRTPRAEREARRLFGSDPAANRMDLLAGHLELIRQNRTFDSPCYDTGRGIADTTAVYVPRRFNILDGEISTYAQLAAKIDFSIFVDAHWRTQLLSRIGRDVDSRAASPEKAIRTFLQSNLIDAPRYSGEARRRADIVLFREADGRLRLDEAAEPLMDILRESAGGAPADTDFGGLIVPLVTPFDTCGGLAGEMLERHVDFLFENGVRRILVNGTTGEFFSLTREERRRAFVAVRKRFDGIVVMHAGYAGIAETVDEAKWGEEWGADAIMVSAPFYVANAPSKGCIDYFRAVADTVRVPLILYNFPKHTQNPITKDVLEAVQHFALKDSSGNLELMAHTQRYYTGPDTLIRAAMRMGAFGFVSAHANVAPALLARMEKALASGDIAAADAIQEEITRMAGAYSGQHHIAKLKYGLSSVLGGYPAAVRPPLIKADTESMEQVESCLLSAQRRTEKG